MKKRDGRNGCLMNYLSLEVKKVLVIFIVFVSIVITVLHSAYVNIDEMEIQLKQNLSDVANQNAQILQSKVESQFELIKALSRELSGITKETISDKLNEFSIFIDDYNLKRFAFSFPDGTTYSTDGELKDLFYREFFKKGMEGQSYITGVLNDALREEQTQVNVMTIPVYDDGEISGVFGVAYDTDNFNKAMQIESFEGQGQSCIISDTGELIMNMGDDDSEFLEKIYKKITDDSSSKKGSKKDGSSFYVFEDNYYCCVPVELMDGGFTWYIVTMLPADVLTQRISAIQINQFATSISVGILVTLGACFIIFLIKKHQKERLQTVYEDSLTKDTNYAKFCMDMKMRKDIPGWLLSMEITNFNDVVIAVGENSAKVMLQESWKTIKKFLLEEELACHVEDGYFLMFLGKSDKEELLERIEQISYEISLLAKDIHVYGIQAGYGIYQITDDEPIESAYSKAKLASAYTNVDAKFLYGFYNEEKRKNIQYEKQLEESFPGALRNHEFEVWYQPKYSVEDGSIVGSEALVRWRRKDGQLISPGVFIPLFEKNGMIADLDEYMFRTVCKQQKIWMDSGKKIYPVSINISQASLYRMDLAKRYSDILAENGTPSEYIQMEVTESTISGKADINKILNEFRSIGIKILMDDFGAGYSSLAMLSTQCFDTLKLDKSLIDNIGSKDGEILLLHVIQMGQQMKLHITAEGVEKRSQVEFLKHMKCDDIQGFYFSKPLPELEYESKLPVA